MVIAQEEQKQTRSPDVLLWYNKHKEELVSYFEQSKSGEESGESESESRESESRESGESSGSDNSHDSKKS